MQLEKFYLDLVAPSGEGSVGYAARVSGAPFIASAVVQWSADAAPVVRQQRTIRGTLPAASPDGWRWQCPALGVEGEWAPRAGGFSQTLWSESGHRVQWQVLAPAATVTLRRDGRVSSGLGYAERLSLDIAPWRLPIAALRWGRFISETDTIVWIAWAYARPRQWLWHNGRAAEPLTISDQRIAWPGHELLLDPPRVIRTGRLAETTFARWKPLQRFLPAAVRNYDETKWCARGTVQPGAQRGWAIHEYVRMR